MSSPTCPAEQLVYSVIDTETTGLNQDSDRIIELCVVTVKGTTVVDQWDTLISIGNEPVNGTHIHGITDADLRGAPTFAQIAGTLVDRLASTVIVAHNARFDIGFLKAEMARLGHTWPNPPTLCTLEGARHRLPGLPKYTLAAVADHLDVTLDNAHAAAADTLACAHVFTTLIASTPALPVANPALTRWPTLTGHAPAKSRTLTRVNA